MPADYLSHQRYLLATVPPERGARALAQSVIGASVVGVILAAPFANMRVTFVPSLLAAYAAALTVNDLITAVLLFYQFAWLRRPSLLVIASGYLFDVCLIMLHISSFPGVFSQFGLLGAGSQTTAWLFLLWHAGFPVFILAYALFAGSTRDVLPVNIHTNSAVLAAIAAVIFLTIGLLLVVTLGQSLLPTLITGGDAGRVFSLGISPGVLALSALAIAAMWRRRNATLLDLLLLTVMCLWFCEVSMSGVFGTVRFSLGWYAGRAFGLVGSSLVLGSLLLESSRLYAKLKDALAAAEVQNAELVRSRGEFARLQRLDTLGQLTGGIAHDFNNLLTVIVGGLDMIARNPEDHVRVGYLAQNATRAAERGTQLIRQLMTFARKQNLKPEMVSPNVILSQSQTLASKAAGAKVTVTLALNQAIYPVLVDVAEFQAAILNLVSNARDAMPDGGTLRIESRNVEFGAADMRDHPGMSPGRHVMIEVSDSGVGMSLETQARIFEPFFTTKPLGQGTGLGLSQVYGFAKSANGDVVVRSELGFGTTFALYLPRSPDRLLVSRAIEAAAPPPARTGPPVSSRDAA